MDFTAEQGAKTICEIFATENPFFVGRNGTIEVEVLYFWLTHRHQAGASRKLEYAEAHKKYLENNAGVFPTTAESLDRWCEEYVEALSNMNCCAAGWYQPMVNKERALLDGFARTTCYRCPLRSLEPYYAPAGLRWTEKLKGRRVCVVSSFADTMQKQLGKAIWTGDRAGLLEGPEWSFVRTGYAPSVAAGRAGWPSGCESWEQAVTYMVAEVELARAEVAVIGCGGLGMVIAGRLRKKGISCIVMGGAIQVLFGIKGKRWATHGVISGFWNDAWVSPAADEIPEGAASVEGGCYW
jgi:hypothetical protein